MDAPALDDDNGFMAVNGYENGEEVDTYQHCVEKLYTRVDQV